jgi:hypothetical protein
MDPVDCCSPCTTQVAPVAVVGPQGATGPAGTNGTNGVNAFTTLTAQVGPTPGDTTTTYNLPVASSVQFVVGQDLIAGQGPGAILANPGPLAVVITAIPAPNSITVKNLRVADQGVTVSSGAVVSVSGFLPAVPITIAQGGTNSTTKAAAQTALGLGQTSLVSSAATGTAQVITGAFVQVGAIDIQITAAGLWELRGHIMVDFNGVTFAASRVISAKIRNVTQGVDLATGVINTQAVTTTSFPSHALIIPPVSYAGVVANDHIQILVMINTINSAGTLSVDAGNLEAIPLRLS